MKKPIFRGMAVALMTPFTEDGSEINYKVLDELVDFHLENSTDAIVVSGTGGESATLTTDEKMKLLAAVIKRVDGQIPVIMGTGANSTKATIERSKMAEEVGANALMVVTPYYNKATQTGLVNHFTAVADSVKLPIIMYNVPGRTSVNMQADTVAELAKHPNINAIKEASGDMVQVCEIVAKCGDNLNLYSGEDALVYSMLALGGIGVISTIGNVKPKDVHDMCFKYFSGDFKGARNIQFKQLDLIATIFSELSPIPIKKAVNLMGIDVGPCRMPLGEISDACLARLKKALEAYDED